MGRIFLNPRTPSSQKANSFRRPGRHFLFSQKIRFFRSRVRERGYICGLYRSGTGRCKRSPSRSARVNGWPIAFRFPASAVWSAAESGGSVQAAGYASRAQLGQPPYRVVVRPARSGGKPAGRRGDALGLVPQREADESAHFFVCEERSESLFLLSGFRSGRRASVFMPA